MKTMTMTMNMNMRMKMMNNREDLVRVTERYI